MKRYSQRVNRFIHPYSISVWLLCVCFVSFAEETKAQKVVIGLYPLLSPSLLTHRMQPLADYVRFSGVSDVTITVDASYEDFITNAQKGVYDIVQAPAHIAAYLIGKGNFEPVAKWDIVFSSVILTKSGSPLKSIMDLMNKSIAIPNPYAFVTIAALSHLQDSGLAENRDFKLLRKATHDRSLMALIRKEADACVMSSAMLSMVDTTIRKELKILSQVDSLDADILLVRKGSTVIPKGTDYFRNFFSGKQGKLFLEKWKTDRPMITINSFEIKRLHKYTQTMERMIDSH